MTDDEFKRLEDLFKKATPGPWEVDTLQNEGDYGNGEDVSTGFSSYAICAGNKTVVDTLNSDLAMVEVDSDCDENGMHSWSWDEVGRRNAEFIATLVTAFPDLIALARIGAAVQPRPIEETLSVDGSFIAFIQVQNNKTGEKSVEKHLVWIDEDTGEISDDCEQGWRLEDYECFIPLSALPQLESKP